MSPRGNTDSASKPKPEAGLVPVDAVVRRFNALNSAIVALVPAVAVANDTLNRVVPLLRQMQQLLSQRPHGTGRPGYRILHRLRGIVVGATPATRAADLPSWSMWLQAYAIELNYSVRHLQRLIYAEPRKKTIKKCGWSASDHNRLIAAAGLALELAGAIEAGVDTVALVAKVHEMLDGSEDLLDERSGHYCRLSRRPDPAECAVACRGWFGSFEADVG